MYRGQLGLRGRVLAGICSEGSKIKSVPPLPKSGCAKLTTMSLWGSAEKWGRARRCWPRQAFMSMLTTHQSLAADTPLH